MFIGIVMLQYCMGFECPHNGQMWDSEEEHDANCLLEHD